MVTVFSILVVSLAIYFIISLLLSKRTVSIEEIMIEQVPDKRRVNSEVFDETRLERGLSGFQLSIETGLSPQSVQRIITGKRGSHPSTVKKVGEYLGIPAKQWYK